MESPSRSRRSSPGSSRSRRSYPSLQHISLTALPANSPPKDEGGPADYFSPRNNDSHHSNPLNSSYIASSSVPTTPGVLADSRNVSYSKLANKKRLSDTYLDDLNVHGPLHHSKRGRSHQRGGSKSHSSRTGSSSRQDNEWLLRAGLALSDSTREQKGQSWLAKRESSTNLVSEPHQDENRSHHERRYRHAGRAHRSGASTPLVSSRRPSGSHSASSRHTNRAELSMTTRDPSAGDEHSPPHDQADVLPDFVDESVRRQMASFASAARDEDDQNQLSRRSSVALASVLDIDGADSDWDSENDDDLDEVEMQRLTRERGFGLGSWVDRLVEWTLFSVEEDYPTNMINSAPAILEESPDGQDDHLETVETEEGASDTETESYVADTITVVERPGNQGGWRDIAWLLRVAQRVVL